MLEDVDRAALYVRDEPEAHSYRLLINQLGAENEIYVQIYPGDPMDEVNDVIRLPAVIRGSMVHEGDGAVSSFLVSYYLQNLSQLT